ncbi:response regulator transcription factor [Spirosoma sp. BT702]|uniref:Response regulator transcription factor n=1 Tax=Spirosoma profusum TaxID=2771354 RepID=A0A926XT69_9BACT|nr:LytTR family DNA-binding domain-containing protein [Spirosoma profusum]MBD2699174.1 response regulator transcription factor [Spirosoma profusum]
MKIQKYIIVDDMESDALDLRAQLAKLPFLQLVGICPTIETTIELLATEHVDLILLDIKLSTQSGLFLLKSGIELPPVIITSAYPEFALESYEIGKAADYLLKPFSFERLLIAIYRALGIQASPTSFSSLDYIFLKMGRKVQRFDFQNIDFIEAYGIYSKVYSNNHSSVVNERLAMLTNLLPNHMFLRVHKSFIINIAKITSYDRSALWVHNFKIPIGVSFRSKLEGILRLFSNNDQDS